MPVKTSVYRKFLKSLGCVYERTKASHELWSKDGCTRPITFQGANKDIPDHHIKTNNVTLGLTKKEFDKLISEL